MKAFSVGIVGAVIVAQACDRAPVTPPAPPLPERITITSPAPLTMLPVGDTVVTISGTATAGEPVQRIRYAVDYHDPAYGRSFQGHPIFEKRDSRATSVQYTARIPLPPGEDTIRVVAEWHLIDEPKNAYLKNDDTVRAMGADTTSVVVRVRRPVKLSLVERVLDTIYQRGFSVSIAGAPDFGTKVQLAVDPGTRSEQQSHYAQYDQGFDGGTPLANGIRLETLDTVSRGPHRYVVRAFDQFGPVDSIVGQFVSVVGERRYHVIALPGLGVDAVPLRLNASGTAVGTATMADRTTRGVRWQNGAISEIPAPTGYVTVTANDLNAAGDVAGCVSNGSATLAAVWYDQPRILTAGSCEVRINDAGTVLVVTDYNTSTLFRHDGLNAAVPLAGHALNNHEEVVGEARSSDASFHAAASPRGLLVGSIRGCCSPHYYSTFFDVNDAEQAIGTTGGATVFLSTSTAVTDLTPMLGATTAAPVVAALNEKGTALAFEARTRAVLLWDGKVSVVRLDDPRWQIDRVTDINEAGVITAHAIDGATGRPSALLLVPVP